MVADIVQPHTEDSLVIDTLIDPSVFLRQSRGNTPLSIRELNPPK